MFNSTGATPRRATFEASKRPAFLEVHRFVRTWLLVGRGFECHPALGGQAVRRAGALTAGALLSTEMATLLRPAFFSLM